MAKRTNKELVRVALDEHRWINTPVVYTTFGSNFSSLQQDLMLMVSGHLQDHLKKFLDDGRFRDKLDPNPMITEDDLKNLPPIHIDLNSLGVGDGHYADIDKALVAVRELWVKAPIFDKEGTGLKTGDDWFPIFKKVHIPTPGYNKHGEAFQYKDKDGNVIEDAKRRSSFIELTINDEVAATVFSMTNGYFNHLERIALWCNSCYTSRLYLLLMKYVSKGQMTPTIPFFEIKDFLGMIERMPKSKDVVKEKYEKYSHFSKLVLNVARKDMDRLAQDNKIEIVLDTSRNENGYEPIYRGRTKRGNPDFIKFFIKRSALGIARDIELHRPLSEERLLNATLKLYPTLDKTVIANLFSAVPDDVWHDFRNYVYDELPKAVERPHRWDGTHEEFVVWLMRNFVSQWKPKQKEEKGRVVEPDLFSQAGVEVEQPINPQPSTINPQPTFIPHDKDDEWQKFLSIYDGSLKSLLLEARHIGTNIGHHIIEFDTKEQYEAYCAAEDKNRAEQQRMMQALSEATGHKCFVLQRGYKGSQQWQQRRNK